jgi:hypothetical protein
MRVSCFVSNVSIRSNRSSDMAALQNADDDYTIVGDDAESQ